METKSLNPNNGVPLFAYTLSLNVLIGMLLLEDDVNSIDPFRIMNWNPRLIVITVV